MVPPLSKKSQNPTIPVFFEVGHCFGKIHTKYVSGYPVHTCYWRLWIRSAGGHDISPIIERVIFKIRPQHSIASTLKVVDTPPYHIIESTACDHVTVYIKIYIKIGNNILKKRRKIKHFVDIARHKEDPHNDYCKKFDYKFVNPSDELKKYLLLFGGTSERSNRLEM